MHVAIPPDRYASRKEGRSCFCTPLPHEPGIEIVADVCEYRRVRTQCLYDFECEIEIVVVVGRVAVARALAQRPQLMLADEPIASLDPEAAVDVMKLLRRLADDGLAVMCVLHQPDLAQRYADRVIGLSAGRVAFSTNARNISNRDIDQLYGKLAA